MTRNVAANPNPVNSDPSGAPKRYDFIDALRGWAILGVIGSHVSIVGPKISNLPPLLNFLVGKGHLGVQLFFIVSACTLFLSMDSRWKVDRRPLCAFFTRRFFRIAPLFWLATLFYWAAGFGERSFYAPNGIAWPHVVSTLAFVHAWYPTTTSSVTPGGWSIGVEMNFYLLVPILYLWIRSLRSALVLTAISTTIAAVYIQQSNAYLGQHFPAEWGRLINTFVYLSFPAQFPVFCLGIVVYQVLLAQKVLSVDRHTTNQLATPAMFVGGILAMFLPPLHVVASAALSAFVLFLSKRPMWLFVNPLTRFIGTVSFSAYICHYFVLETMGPWMVIPFQSYPRTQATAALEFAAVFGGTALATTLVSWITYRLIEVPGQDMGRWLIQKKQWGR